MMAQPCVFTSAASASSSLIRFNTASPIPSSCSDTTTLSLPSHHRFPFRSSKLRNIHVDQRNTRNYAVKKGLKSVYSGGLWESNWSSCQGISSIRDDLQVPSSHYFQVNNVYGEEGPPPVVQEGLQFVASKLFEHRIIRCGGPVDADMANFIVAQLLYLDAVDPNKDIVMYVNSPGGSVTAGMAIFDMMRHIRPDVSTVCVGLAARGCEHRLSSWFNMMLAGTWIVPVQGTRKWCDTWPNCAWGLSYLLLAQKEKDTVCQTLG